MSQNEQQRRQGNRGDEDRSPFENAQHDRYEGYEGMNYEQQRQPYQPGKHKNQRDRSSNDPSGSDQKKSS
jgi:hypothetical protein